MSRPVLILPVALDRARTKAYRRLLPILFLCYVVAYVDRNNVSIAFTTMKADLNRPWLASHGPIHDEKGREAFDKTGRLRADVKEGMATPGRRSACRSTTTTSAPASASSSSATSCWRSPARSWSSRWSAASKWISRIMISWGIMAALTAFVSSRWQFYGARFLLGLAEAEYSSRA